MILEIEHSNQISTGVSYDVDTVRNRYQGCISCTSIRRKNSSSIRTNTRRCRTGDAGQDAFVIAIDSKALQFYPTLLRISKYLVLKKVGSVLKGDHIGQRPCRLVAQGGLHYVMCTHLRTRRRCRPLGPVCSVVRHAVIFFKHESLLFAIHHLVPRNFAASFCLPITGGHS